MTKILHVFVYIFLVLAGAALWFELQLNGKRDAIVDRSRMQEDYLIQIAGTIECEEPGSPDSAIEIKKDVSPVEDSIVDTPDTENVLEDYKSQLEKQSLKTFSWGQAEREQLRRVYALDFEGNVIMDGNIPLKEGANTEKELLEKLFKACVAQQARLNTTRSVLPVLREKLDAVVKELNKLKPEARQDKVALAEKDEQISKLEAEKKELADSAKKIKAQIDELNAEVTSVKDELLMARDDAAMTKEDLAKAKQAIERYQKMLKEAMLASSVGGRTDAGLAITSLPSGDKGVIAKVDNENMFAVLRLSEEALKQLKGGDANRQLPVMELSVKRPGFKGQAGEFVGRIRLRQEVAGKPYVICDILSNWSQDTIKDNDIVYAD